MDSAVLLALTTAGVLVAMAVVVLVVLARDRSHARAEAALARAEAEELRARVEELAGTLEQLRVDRERERAYLITDAGERPEPNVPDQVVLSATVGEPLVKVVAFGHGLRRALAPESRDRIRSAVRREVRRQRKQRRREMKEAWRRMQAHEKADLRAADAA
jgi:hypothetical protein